MSKKLIEEVLSNWGDVPDSCKKQIELQKEYYYRLIEKMEEYDWRDVFSVGIKIREKDGDPQVFMSQLANPVRLSLFIPSDESNDASKLVVRARTLPSLLEEKFRTMDIYLGPIGQKVMGPKGEEFTSPFKYVVGKDRVVRLTCV